MKLLDVAMMQIGVQEDTLHTNHGEAVKYQIAAGLPKGGGFPWCQSFVYWCGLMAYGSHNPIPRTAGVLDCWNKAPEECRIPKAKATAANIETGMQFVLNFGAGMGHTGIVLKVYPDGSFDTIEGNSNQEGGRDGYEVAKREGIHKRRITDKLLQGFIAWHYPDTVAV